jgi:hypothetical protein
MATPPYALDAPAFRFRALAALAGRASLGGEREAALATLLAARLVAGALAPDRLPVELRAARAQAARGWLGALALPAGQRAAIARVIDASGGESLAPIAPSIERLRDALTRHLDAASLAELATLERALRNA